MIIALLALAASLAAARDTSAASQGVDYRIEATLNEETHVLRGRARLTYTNRSTSTLDTLWFHQHLNAFRPNSAWARRELQFGERRFQDLGREQHAFERLTRAAVGGRAVRPVYPGSPDSTVVGIPLPTPLRPGGQVVVDLDWDARLATVPRRQGRQGRSYNWAHWYPRIAVFERGRWQTQPLLPQGEFYGEFGSYDVTLEVRSDQVIGATGVPAEGDPGWERAAVTPATEIHYQRDHYPARQAVALGLLGRSAPAERKRVRWRAEKVHHFAWASSPEYRYEGGRHGKVSLHVLYTPAQAADWGGGTVLARTVEALDWLEATFGPFPYPQLTTAPRIEARGATEYPMIVMNGSASQGLIVHEATHQYAHAVLANNEWREGWLDEGLTEYVTHSFWEARGDRSHWDRLMEDLRAVERAGRSEVVAQPGAGFSDPAAYSRMTYSKPAATLRMLRDLVGAETMERILREYFRRHAFQHVSEEDLRRVASEIAGQDLDWFFHQWLHTTHRLDYRVRQARSERTADGRWRTRVEIARAGEAWMPVTLQVGSERLRLTSREPVQTVEVTTAARPAEVVLDPDNVLLDVNPGNNRKTP